MGKRERKLHLGCHPRRAPRISGAREGDPGGEYRALHRLLGSLPLAKLKLRSAGNDSFEIVSTLSGGITQ